MCGIISYDIQTEFQVGVVYLVSSELLQYDINIKC